jgi:hypothetical protein
MSQNKWSKINQISLSWSKKASAIKTEVKLTGLRVLRVLLCIKLIINYWGQRSRGKWIVRWSERICVDKLNKILLFAFNLWLLTLLFTGENSTGDLTPVRTKYVFQLHHALSLCCQVIIHNFTIFWCLLCVCVIYDQTSIQINKLKKRFAQYSCRVISLVTDWTAGEAAILRFSSNFYCQRSSKVRFYWIKPNGFDELSTKLQLLTSIMRR